MPNVHLQPLVQPPVEDLKNCLQIANAWAEGQPPLTAQAFVRIAQLIRHALEQLGEPNLASIQAAAVMLREHEGLGAHDQQRDARDVAAVILRAAVTGEIPRTWSHG